MINLEKKNNAWLFVGVLLTCFAVSAGVRYQQFEHWKKSPAAYFVGEQQKYGCTDPNADNYDAEATADDGSCFFRDCFDNQRYVIYLDGDSVGSTQLDFFLFPNLANGIQYNFKC